MDLIKLYRSENNRGILFRWVVNILALCLFLFIAMQISEWGSTPGNEGLQLYPD